MFRIITNAVIDITNHFEAKQPPRRVVDHLEMKIDLLTKLAGDFNPQISNKLKMIIDDLQA